MERPPLPAGGGGARRAVVLPTVIEVQAPRGEQVAGQVARHAAAAGQVAAAAQVAAAVVRPTPAAAAAAQVAAAERPPLPAGGGGARRAVVLPTVIERRVGSEAERIGWGSVVGAIVVLLLGIGAAVAAQFIPWDRWL